LRQNLISSIQENFKTFNIKGVQFGKNVINFNDINIEFQSTADENEILQSIHIGEKIFLLSVTNMNTGYWGKNKVNIEEQKIENLLNIELIKELDKNIKILHPQDEKPFQEFMNPHSYIFIIKGENNLQKIWENLQMIVKKDWHDNIMKKQKHYHSFDNVFQIKVYYNIANDFLLRLARFKKAQKIYEEEDKLSNYSSVAQQELKNTLRSLILIENHPIFASKINKIIEEIKPILADSMAVKNRVELLRKDMDKKLNNVYHGFYELSINCKDWKKELPDILQYKKNKNKCI
jgi:hypothetical protein